MGGPDGQLELRAKIVNKHLSSDNAGRAIKLAKREKRTLQCGLLLKTIAERLIGNGKPKEARELLPEISAYAGKNDVAEQIINWHLNKSEFAEAREVIPFMSSDVREDMSERIEAKNPFTSGYPPTNLDASV